MRGKLLTFEVNRGGLISGDDGKRYEFVAGQWPPSVQPKIGTQIDFMIENDFAKDIIPLTINEKHSRGILALVCWFLGVLGIHRFMVGKTGTGILMLVLTISIFGIFISMIWALIDLIVILCGSFRDKNNNPIQQWWPQ